VFILLGISTNSKSKPKIKGMWPNACFYKWQPLAIHAFLQMYEDPLLTGVILADKVGLGKTCITVSFLLKIRDNTTILGIISPGTPYVYLVLLIYILTGM
jgi:hypothetical protein